MKILRKERDEIVKVAEIQAGETFKTLSGSKIFIKLQPSYTNNINAVNLYDGEGFCFSDNISVIKITGEFVEK